MRLTVARQRLHNQHLVAPTFTDPVDVVRVLGAVQSQDYANAKWAVGQRGRAITDPDVERALTSGHIIRTHVLRPTWHFVAREDVRWMLALTAPRVSAAMGYFNRPACRSPSHASGVGWSDSGARRGKQFTYALLEERVPPTRQWVGDEALAELARRGSEAAPFCD